MSTIPNKKNDTKKEEKKEDIPITDPRNPLFIPVFISPLFT